MAVKLYALALSHPSQAARLMLEHKGIEHEVKDLFPGAHPAQLRLAGFRAGTVPGLKIDGRRVQGSLDISRALDDLQAEPRLFPADPEQRRAVEDAEAWGERPSCSRSRGACFAGARRGARACACGWRATWASLRRT